MACADTQKILYCAYMLFEEAEYQWDNARQIFEANGTMITWAIFRGAFLKKYFSAYVRSKKEVESLNLNMGICMLQIILPSLRNCLGFALTIMGSS